MSLIGALKKIGKAVSKTAESVGSVAKDVANTAKDVGTSAVRIVTDTAIDAANVATGFQFNESMEAAKTAMDDAGLKSAATAIRDNHYPDIDSLIEALSAHRDTVEQKISRINALNDEATARGELYNSFLAKVSLISQLQTEVTCLLRVTRGELPELRDYQSRLSEVLKRKSSTPGRTLNATQRILAYSSLATGFGAAAGTITAVASSAAKTVKLAGRVSAVLAVAGVGLDAGMAFASYEKQLKQLREAKEKADALERDLDKDLASLQTHRDVVDSAIETILGATDPRQTEASFLDWADASIKELMDVKAQLEKEARGLMKEVLGTLIGNGETNLSTLSDVARLFLPDIGEADIEQVVFQLTEEEKSWQAQ